MEKANKSMSSKNATKRAIFCDDIHVDGNQLSKIVKKKKFLKEIDGNVEMLNMLSIDRLKKLEKYYDSIIKQNEEIIRKLEEDA